MRGKIEKQDNSYTFIASIISLGQWKLIKNTERKQVHLCFDSEDHGICLCFENGLLKLQLEKRPLSQAIAKKFGMFFI